MPILWQPCMGGVSGYEETVTYDAFTTQPMVAMATSVGVHLDVLVELPSNEGLVKEAKMEDSHSLASGCIV